MRHGIDMHGKAHVDGVHFWDDHDALWRRRDDWIDRENRRNRAQDQPDLALDDVDDPNLIELAFDAGKVKKKPRKYGSEWETLEPKFGPSSVSGTPITPFVVKYDTYDEISLRLRNTVININDAPYHVLAVDYFDDTTWLLAEDRKHARWKIDYKNDKLDLRSPQPKYVSYETREGGQKVGYFHRIPARVYRQGLTTANCCITAVGAKKTSISPYSIPHILHILQKQEDVRFSKDTEEYVCSGNGPKSCRLTNDIAVFRKQGGLAVEYKTREIGTVKKSHVTFNDKDSSAPWIQEAIRYAGFTC